MPQVRDIIWDRAYVYTIEWWLQKIVPLIFALTREQVTSDGDSSWNIWAQHHGENLSNEVEQDDLACMTDNNRV